MKMYTGHMAPVIIDGCAGTGFKGFQVHPTLMFPTPNGQTDGQPDGKTSSLQESIHVTREKKTDR